MNSIRFTQEQLYVTSKIGYVGCDAKISPRHSATSSQSNIFWRTLTLLSLNNQDHTSMGDYIIPVLNQQTRLLQDLWRLYLIHTFNNALTVTLHISLRQIAAKIPSQLHSSCLLSFQQDLQHKRKPFIPRCY